MHNRDTKLHTSLIWKEEEQRIGRSINNTIFHNHHNYLTKEEYSDCLCLVILTSVAVSEGANNNLLWVM